MFTYAVNTMHIAFTTLLCILCCYHMSLDRIQKKMMTYALKGKKNMDQQRQGFIFCFHILLLNCSGHCTSIRHLKCQNTIYFPDNPFLIHYRHLNKLWYLRQFYFLLLSAYSVFSDCLMTYYFISLAIKLESLICFFLLLV